jgi:hypothetical protein
VDIAVEFESKDFAPFLPEDSQVNPNVYGAELAFWLSEQLAKSGIATSYPNYEDWGWFLEYITESGDEYWLCCGNRDGSKDKWLCYLAPRAKGMFGRNKARVEGAAPLLDALRGILAESSSITGIQWSEDPYGA